MKKKLFSVSILFSLLFLLGCNGNADKERAKVTELRKTLYDKNSILASHEVAEKAIVEFRNFGKKFPKDSAALRFHTESAEIAWTIGQHKLSTEIFKEIMDIHPDAENMPYICIRLGSIYNDNLRDTAEAKKYFQMVLDKFPGSEFVKGAKFGLETLGMDERQQFDYMLRKNNITRDSLS
jgi:outer membrane protein assembly factor BamD (BamD/ComL family)